MAKKEDRKKQKKRLQERKKLLHKQKWAQRSRYPRIVIHNNGEDPRFISEVTRIAGEFDFDLDSCCDKDMRALYQLYRKIGLTGLQTYVTSPAVDERRRQLGVSVFELQERMFGPILSHLGQWIFDRLPEHYRTDPLPFYYYHIAPIDNRLEITFEFLPRKKSPHGTIYSSPLKPSIRLAGNPFRVGFLRHPLERACRRMALRLPITYPEFQRCFYFFRHCVYFEQVELKDHELAMRLYAPCLHDSLRQIYVQDVARLESADMSSMRYHHVLGYCPLTIINGYAVAKTFLLPGYRATPEAELFESAPAPRHYRERMRALTANLSFEQIYNAEAVEPLRFFHENGVPQLVEFDHPVLDFSGGEGS